MYYMEKPEEGRSNPIYNNSNVRVVNMGGSKKLKCQFSIIVNLLHLSRKI